MRVEVLKALPLVLRLLPILLALLMLAVGVAEADGPKSDVDYDPW